MNHEVLVLLSCIPFIIIWTLFALVPIGVRLYSGLLSYLDDNEGTIKYPSPYHGSLYEKLGVTKVIRYKYHPDTVHVNDSIIFDCLFFGSMFSVAFVVAMYNVPTLTLLVGGIVIIGYTIATLARKVFRIGKKLNKHINNAELHNSKVESE